MADKIGDAKLAQKIIGAFSDLDGLTFAECAATGLAEDECRDLKDVLKGNPDYVISGEVDESSWAISKMEREYTRKHSSQNSRY